MKQLFLTLAIALFGYASYAQTYLPLTAGSGNALTGTLYGAQIKSTGSGAGFYFDNRSDLSKSWAWYSDTFGAALFNPYTTLNVLTSDASGNIGIGTTTPDFPSSGVKVLTVSGSTVRGMLLLQNSSTGTNGAAGTIQGYNGSTFLGSVDIFADGATNSGAFQFYTVNGGSNVQAMRITKEGNVGIGTTSPGYLLDVNGSMNLGNLASGSDAILHFSTNASGGPRSITYRAATAAVSIDNTAGSALMTILNGGNVGIGTTTPDQLLSVAGTIHSKEVKVDLIGWPDYVFKPKYRLAPLTEIKAYIEHNQHLPDMPSEKEVKDNGINLGEIVKVQTKKIEELTLYAIEQQKQIEQQQTNHKQDEARIAALEAALAKLTTNNSK